MDADMKRKILRIMGLFAEKPLRENNFHIGEEKGFIDMAGRNFKIRGFKPTLADRLLFKSIVEENEERIDVFYKKRLLDHLKDDPSLIPSVGARDYFSIAVGMHMMGIFYSKYGYE